MKQVTYRIKVNPTVETSYGTVSKAKGIIMEQAITIKDDDTAFCEMYDINGNGEWYAGVGLWFDDGALTDYDGIFEVPDHLLYVLKKEGFDVAEMAQTLESDVSSIHEKDITNYKSEEVQ